MLRMLKVMRFTLRSRQSTDRIDTLVFVVLVVLAVVVLFPVSSHTWSYAVCGASSALPTLLSPFTYLMLVLMSLVMRFLGDR